MDVLRSTGLDCGCSPVVAIFLMFHLLHRCATAFQINSLPRSVRKTLGLPWLTLQGMCLNIALLIVLAFVSGIGTAMLQCRKQSSIVRRYRLPSLVSGSGPCTSTLALQSPGALGRMACGTPSLMGRGVFRLAQVVHARAHLFVSSKKRSRTRGAHGGSRRRCSSQ